MAGVTGAGMTGMTGAGVAGVTGAGVAGVTGAGMAGVTGAGVAGMMTGEDATLQGQLPGARLGLHRLRHVAILACCGQHKRQGHRCQQHELQCETEQT